MRLRVMISDFSGFFFVISSKVKPELPRRPGDVGLNCLTAIDYTPSNSSIFSPGASVTIAFFQSGCFVRARP